MARHGIDPDAEVAQQFGWWTTATGINHLVPDYTRVTFAKGLDMIRWNPAIQKYDIVNVDEAGLDASMRRSGAL